MPELWCTHEVSEWLFEKDPDTRTQFDRTRCLVPVKHALKKFTGGQTLLHIIADDMRAKVRKVLAANKQGADVPDLAPIPLEDLLAIPGLEQHVNAVGEAGTLECRTALEQLANQNKSGVGEPLKGQIKTFFDWLVQHKANVDANNGQALLLAMGSGNYTAVAALLEARADIGVAQAGWNQKQGRPSAFRCNGHILKLLEKHGYQQPATASRGAGSSRSRSTGPPRAWSEWEGARTRTSSAGATRWQQQSAASSSGATSSAATGDPLWAK